MANLIKKVAAAIFLLIGLIGFSCSYKIEPQATNLSRTPEKILDATGEITGYKNWTMVNKKPALITAEISQQ